MGIFANRSLASNGVNKLKKIPPPLSNPALNTSETSLSALSTSLSPFSPTFGSPTPYESGIHYPYDHLPSHDLPASAKSEAFDFDNENGYIVCHPGAISPPFRYVHHSQTSQSSIDTFIDPNETGFYSSTNTSYNDIPATLNCGIPVTSLSYPTMSMDPAMYPVRSPPIKLEDAEEDQLYNFGPVQEEDNRWPMGFPSPAMSSHSSLSSDSQYSKLTITHGVPIDPSDPNVLIMHFHKSTSRIMSVKNGPGENPWRTLIWPMAQETPALYHAISAMTAFHLSREQPAFRVQGVDHVRTSLNALSSGIGSGSLSDEGALATTLVLVFAEAFDRHVTTGTEHLKGAKVLVSRALARCQHTPQYGENIRRLKFLCNVWMYLDVLARLTSDNDDEVANPIAFGPVSPTEEIDPLMGCASTLFPLIGRVADLARRVRQNSTSNLNIISEAIKLKSLLESWVPPSYHELEDTTTTMEDCLKTAEAYRHSTLLYLHQAVPGIPSLPSRHLAKRVFSLIASIPVTSSACNMHIYPLLAAGCEAQGLEERDWVKSRWEQLSARMWVGNVDRAWEVVKEVWDRRDKHTRQNDAEEQLLRGASSLRATYSNPGSRSSSVSRSLTPEKPLRHTFTPEPDNASLFDGFGCPIDPRDRKPVRPTVVRSSSEGLMDEYGAGAGDEITVNSRLHWIGVMQDWQWEGMFTP